MIGSAGHYSDDHVHQFREEGAKNGGGKFSKLQGIF